MTTLRRRSRQIDMLLTGLDGVRAAAERVVRALPSRPSGRDEAALAVIAAQLPDLMTQIQRASARVRRDLPSDEMRDLLETARITAREIPGVVSGLAAVLERRAEPLIAPRAPVSAASRRAWVLSRGFNLLEVAASGPEQADDMRAYAFPFIPLGADSFVERMQAVWRLLAVCGQPDLARFLEVGAGAGSKLFLAAQFFPVVEGIELDAHYLARAELLGNATRPERRVHRADALSFDGYGDYDVIYSYLPPIEPEVQTMLEQCILDQARPGAIIVLPMMRSRTVSALPWLEGEILVKGLDGDALSALAREAQLVGVAVPPVLQAAERGGRRNLMLPAIDALARAGFAA